MKTQHAVAFIALAAVALAGCENTTQPDGANSNDPLFASGPPVNPGKPSDPGPPDEPGQPDDLGQPDDPGTPTFCIAPPPGLISWWPGDGDATDIFGSNNGALVGDATFTAGKVEQGFLFDGDGDYVEVPHNASLNLLQFTVDAWIFVDRAQLAAKFHSIVGKSNGSSIGFGFHIGYDTRNNIVSPPTQNGLLFTVFAENGTSSRPFIIQTLLSAGFYHVAGTFDGSVARLYLDGTLVATGGSVSAPAGFNTLPLRIGALHFLDVFGFDDRFEGIIDEVEIFNRALSATEIQAIFNAGSAGKCKA